MGSLLEALQAREAAARTRLKALQAEMDRLAEHLAAEQELLGRLEITRQTVIEVLAGEELPGGDAVGIDPDLNAGVGAAAPTAGTKVPVFGQDGDGHRLPVAYQDVVEVLADAGPLRARQVCQAVGVGPSPAIGRGCGSSSSGWSSAAGWSRPSRGCSPARLGWLRRWTVPTDSGLVR